MNAIDERPARLLIVDDASSLRAVLRALLRDAGHQLVGELACGARLMQAVAQLRPDIVCLDYNLPDGNGLDLLKALHAHHPEVAVVMITGSEDVTLESQAAESSAAGFLRKPFSPENILAVIDQVWRAQQLFRRHRARRATVAAGQVSLQQARARAVVVDDSATMRQLLGAILEHANVEVAGEAADGQQAIAVVARCQPQLVCLDIDMPVMDGLTALPQLLAASPASRVLMITARAGRDRVLAAAKAGARGYIVKPFDAQKVIEAIEHLLADK